jgi:CheY-like chemotaxis protein
LNTRPVHPPGKSATILVVEDNEDNRIIYGTMLRAHGFVVNEASGGESALVSARTAPPDLVLMDIGLPTMDGVEATRHLKSDPKTSSIPVLALTAHALMSERQRALQAGVDGYLVKPIGVAALIREVERALMQAAERLSHATDALPAR